METLQNRNGLPDDLIEEKRFFALLSSKKDDTPNGWNTPDNWVYLDDIPEDKVFGFAIGNGTNYLFIDMDHVRNPETGDIVPWIRTVFNRISQFGQTYTEISMSGTGIHMICDLGEYADFFSKESNSPNQIIIDMNPDEFSKLPKEEQDKIPKIELFYHTGGRYIYLTGKHKKLYQVAKDDVSAAMFKELLKIREEYHEKHGHNKGQTLSGPGKFKIDNPTRERILEALPYISANDRSQWVTIGIALFNCGFSFEVWDNWSQYTDQRAGISCDKYNPEETPKIWNSFKGTNSNWNEGTIIKRAKESGYIVPYSQGRQFSREDILDAVQSMEDVQEVDPEWIVYPYIPKGEVIILASRGGTGKGFIVASILAGITNGKYPEIFGEGNPFQGGEDPVLYLTTEDDISKVLKKRFHSAGVNMGKVKVISRRSPVIQDIKLSDENGILKTLIEELKPSLVIFDPLQSFLPDRVKMGERNQMRACINNLSVIGADTSTSFLILAHMNKRDTVDVQKAIADSADIWDIARSVLVTGKTETEDIKFLSHEKSNYSALGNTSLYRIDEEGKAVCCGTTRKRFEDFILESNAKKYNAPKLAEAEEFIMGTLRDHKGNYMLISELEELCTANKISKTTVRRAKESLKKDKRIVMWPVGYGRERKWYLGFKKTTEGNNLIKAP